MRHVHDKGPMRLTGMKRREFLALCALGAFPNLLAACSIVDGSIEAASPPSDADWTALAKRLKGSLIRPNNAQYATALQLFSPRFDTVRPAAIAYCTSPADVQACLSFAHQFRVPFAPRAGGHSYAGYSTSTGLVIDVTRMNSVSVNASAGIAMIGAGTRLIDVYGTLAQHGFALAAGSCPTVGVAGLTMGGGAGVLGRKFGLTCDNLLSAQVVVADGRVINCDATHDPDLFWAIRGGGGGNFGVATSFTFRIHSVGLLSLFTLRWPWSSAANVVDAWQNWAPHAPDELWSNCLLDSPADKSVSPIIQVNGVYIGPLSQLNALLGQLKGRIPAPLTLNAVFTDTLLNTMLYEAGCYRETVAQCHLPSQNSQGRLRRDLSAVKSDYYTRTLPRQGIDALVNAINRRHASSLLGEGGIGLDSLGGAINRVPANATAFVHRNALFSAQYSASWNAHDSAVVVAANRSWSNATWQAMRPYVSGEAYQNYIDPDLTNWQQAYYGSNLGRLQHIKAVYDPGNFFRFAQSIPPATKS